MRRSCIEDATRACAPFVVIVNEEFARRYFPGENVVGKTLTVGKTTIHIVGLVGKALFPLSAVVQSMRKTQQTALYLDRLGPFFVGRVLWPWVLASWETGRLGPLASGPCAPLGAGRLGRAPVPVSRGAEQ